MDADRIVGQINTPSAACADFIKGWEQCRLVPYRDSGGRWTV